MVKLALKIVPFQKIMSQDVPFCDNPINVTIYNISCVYMKIYVISKIAFRQLLCNKWQRRYIIAACFTVAEEL